MGSIREFVKSVLIESGHDEESDENKSEVPNFSDEESERSEIVPDEIIAAGYPNPKDMIISIISPYMIISYEFDSEGFLLSREYEGFYIDSLGNDVEFGLSKLEKSLVSLETTHVLSNQNKILGGTSGNIVTLEQYLAKIRSVISSLSKSTGDDYLDILSELEKNPSKMHVEESDFIMNMIVSDPTLIVELIDSTEDARSLRSILNKYCLSQNQDVSITAKIVEKILPKDKASVWARPPTPKLAFDLLKTLVKNGVSESILKKRLSTYGHLLSSCVSQSYEGVPQVDQNFRNEVFEFLKSYLVTVDVVSEVFWYPDTKIPYTPEFLDLLSQNKTANVRFEVAKRRNLFPRTEKRLLADKNDRVRGRMQDTIDIKSRSKKRKR